MTSRRTPLPAHAALFPAAALWAAAMAGLKAAAVAGGWEPPGYWPAAWHGHEMLFGFAYAVVGGYLLTRPGTAGVLAALAAWGAGRAALLVPGLPLLMAAPLALAYPLLLFLWAGVPWARTARKPKNRIFAPLIGALAAAEAVYQLGAAGLLPGGPGPGLVLAADLLLTLLFVMAGRFQASVAAGLHQARGHGLSRLTQPRLERAGVVLLGLTALLDPLTAAGAAPAALPGALALAAAAVIGLRLVAWRGWRLLDDPGFAALQAGYLWLGAGLALKGWAQWASQPGLLEALHPALVGGLGTLTLTVMTRVVRQRRGLRPPLPAAGAAAAALVSGAAAARLAWNGTGPWLGLAAAAWVGAWGLFLAGLARARPPRRPARR